MEKFYVYKIINNINNRIYVGKTNDIEWRWYQHLCSAKSEGKMSYYFSYIHAAMYKYGIENFTLEIIEELDNEKLSLEREIYWITTLKTNINKYSKEFGYNLTDGGDGVLGRKMSEKEKQQRSKIMIEYFKNNPHWSLGKTLSEEHRQKISKGNMGKIMSDESKEKNSKSHSGNKNGMFGVPRSIEERQVIGKKISLAKKNNPSPILLPKEELVARIVQAKTESQNSKQLQDYEKDEIIRLYNSGQYIKRDLAEKFEVHIRVIKSIIRNWERVKENKKNYLTDEQKQNIIDLYNSKLHTYKEIATIVNIEYNRVESVIKMYYRKLLVNQ